MHERERVYVRGRESVSKREKVCVRETICVCVCERERGCVHV